MQCSIPRGARAQLEASAHKRATLRKVEAEVGQVDALVHKQTSDIIRFHGVDVEADVRSEIDCLCVLAQTLAEANGGHLIGECEFT